MKLKQWLREKHLLSYAQYKALPDEQKENLLLTFQEDNRREQIGQMNKKNWKVLDLEQKKVLDEKLEQEARRYAESIEIGGIDSRGNYTALHYRNL